MEFKIEKARYSLAFLSVPCLSLYIRVYIHDVSSAYKNIVAPRLASLVAYHGTAPCRGRRGRPLISDVARAPVRSLRSLTPRAISPAYLHSPRLIHILCTARCGYLFSRRGEKQRRYCRRRYIIRNVVFLCGHPLSPLKCGQCFLLPAYLALSFFRGVWGESETVPSVRNSVRPAKSAERRF